MMRILFILFILASFTSVAQTVQTIGSPGTRVNSRGDFISDSIFYLPRTQVASRTPFQSGAIRYQASDSSIYQWTGTAWRKISGTVDSLLFSTRAWRQKGDDSLAAIINTRTDTVNRLSTKAWRQKGIDSVASVRIGGSGVTGRIPKFTAATTLDSSQIIQSGGRIGIGTVSPPITKVQIEAGGGRVLWVTDSAIHTTSANTNITVENHFQDASGVASIDLRTARFGTDGTFGLARVGGVRTGNGTSDLAFSTSASADNPTERMRITSAGESLFGTTTDAGDFRIQVSGNARIQGNTTITNVTKIGGDPAGQDAVGAVLGTVGATHFLASQTKGIARFYFGNHVTSDTLTQGVRLQMGATSSGSTNISGTPYIGSSIENVANAYQGLRFGIAGVGGVREAMRLTVEGAMGLNTPYEPGGLLEVNTIGGTTGSTRMLRLSRNAQAGYGSTNFDQYYNSSSDYGLRIGNDATTWFGLNLFNGRVAINNGTTAGAYQLDVAGNIRSTTDAYFNTSSGESYFGTTSDAGNFRVQVNGVARASDGLATGAPAGGTAATWKLGIVVAGSYTAASNYLQVDVGGTLYYIGLVTPN